MRKNLALLATLSMLVIGLSPLADQPEAKATTVSENGVAEAGDCSIELNSSTDVDVSKAGDDCVIEFKSTAVDYEWTVPSGVENIDVLLVGGGGGGGNLGGGGGGGFLEKLDWTLPDSKSLLIKVGQGGLGSGTESNLKTEDEARGKSTFIGSDISNYSNALDATSVTGNYLQAIGGGGGASVPSDPSPNLNTSFVKPGLSGASSGGSLKSVRNDNFSVNVQAAEAKYATDSESETFGNVGGDAQPSTDTDQTRNGAGGGGAGGAGSPTGGGDAVGGNGGVGKTSSLKSGISFAGGGGGGAREFNQDLSSATPGSGSGGGGDGASRSDNGTETPATSGADNTGGGGGGGAQGDGSRAGKDGGSGILILRYTLPTLVDVGDNCTLVGSPTDVTVSEDGDDCIVEFKSTDVDYEFKVPSNITEAWVLAVGGGGGGGCLGGGGAGGYIEFDQNNKWSIPTTSDGNLSIRVGDGGLGAGTSLTENDKTEAQMRGESTFIGDDLSQYYETTEDLASYTNAVSIPDDQSHIQAIGGGGGGCHHSTDPGLPGASSGGGGGESQDLSVKATSIYSADSLTETLGKTGGIADTAVTGVYINGGGGGASSEGESASVSQSSNSSGDGGSGSSSTIRGNGAEQFAGGGGGGMYVFSGQTAFDSYSQGSGGSGGGGNGALYRPNTTTNIGATPGDQNTGGGGGGGTYKDGKPGANGGSGIAIIRFTIPPTPVTIDNQCSDSDELPNGVSTSNDPANCVVEFTTPGITYDVTLPASVTFDYLLVGGGGAGGSQVSGAGGGGGGGEVNTGSTSSASSSFKIRVGDGGSAEVSSSGQDGRPSTLTVGGTEETARPGKGGAGGGSSERVFYGAGGASGSEEPGGDAYGLSSGSTGSTEQIAAGGGGDDDAGKNASNLSQSTDGDGGGGTAFSGFTLSAVTHSSFGGGGGGGVGPDRSSSKTETSTTDGGGKGTKTNGEAGEPNTGGGGGGSGTNYLGGDGGSGFAAISFSLPFATPVLSEPTPTEDGFEVTITNYQAIQDLAVSEGGAKTDVDDDDWDATADSSASASVSGDKVTVTGLTPTEDASASATVTVTLTPGGSLGPAASATKDGNTLKGQSALTFTPTTPMDYLDSQALSVTGGDGTGSTTFTVDSGPCSIEAGSNVLTTTGVGTCVVDATKAADSVYASKTETNNIAVDPADREISFTSAVPTNPDAGTTYSPTVSITNKNGEVLSDAEVTFSLGTVDTDNGTACTLDDSNPQQPVISFAAEGTCEIEAVSTNTLTPDVYASSATIRQIIEVQTGNQNISFDPIDDKTITSAPFTSNPTSSAGLTVSTEVTEVDQSSTGKCSITGNVVQILSVGECIITASQDGIDGQFAAATPITQSFDIAPVVPGPPILESIGFDSRTINISFTAPSFNGGAAIAGYSMVATDGAGNSFANNDCLASATTCSITGLTNGTQYTTTLVAINSAGESPAATAPSITPAAAADSVGNLLLTKGDGELTASWTKPGNLSGSDFKRYELTLKANGVAVDTHQTTDDIDIDSHTFTGLTNGVEYELELVVISTANDTTLESRTATTQGIPATAPSKVRSITAEIESFDKAFISWAEPESNGGLPITSYELSLGTQSTTTDTFRELTDLPGGDTVITIKAINAVGESTETFTLTLPSPPAPPSQSPSPSPSPSPPYFTPGNNDEDSDDEEQGTQSEDNPGEGPRPENPEDNGFRPTPPTPKTSPDGTPAPATPAAEVIGSDETPEITNEDSKIVTKGSNWEIRVGIGSANDDATDDNSDQTTDANTDNNTDTNQPNDAELTPELTFIAPMRSKIALEAQGLKPNTLMQAWVFSDPQYIGDIEVDENGELIGELDLPETLLPGNHTIQLASINASGETVVINKPITIKGKLTVGTFKGFIAIYSKDLEGQKLSARVAGKWLVQDPIDTFKDFSYGRVVRFTGAGYEINVDLYLNREFFQRVRTVTR